MPPRISWASLILNSSDTSLLSTIRVSFGTTLTSCGSFDNWLRFVTIRDVQTLHEASDEQIEEPIWVLTSPLTVVRFDPGVTSGRWARYNEIGAVYLLGDVDAQRLRSVNLNRLAFIDPRYTPLPRWVSAEPPTESSIREATIDLPQAAADLDHEASAGHGVFDDPLAALTALLDPWNRGEMNEDEAVSFLRSLQLAHVFPSPDEEWEAATALGLRLVAPVTASPVKTLAAAMNQSPNYARQVIHRLRGKGFLAPSLVERAQS
jgi:hypothetical protein